MLEGRVCSGDGQIRLPCACQAELASTSVLRPAGPALRENVGLWPGMAKDCGSAGNSKLHVGNPQCGIGCYSSKRRFFYTKPRHFSSSKTNQETKPVSLILRSSDPFAVLSRSLPGAGLRLRFHGSACEVGEVVFLVATPPNGPMASGQDRFGIYHTCWVFGCTTHVLGCSLGVRLGF